MEDYKNYIIMALLYLAIIFAVYFVYETVRKRRVAVINKSSHINGRGKNKLYFFTGYSGQRQAYGKHFQE